MNIRNVLVRSTAVLGVSLVCVMVGEAIAGPQIVLGCCMTRNCYDEHNNLVSTASKCVPLCRIGQHCERTAGCDENGNAWVEIECVDDNPV